MIGCSITSDDNLFLDLYVVGYDPISMNLIWFTQLALSLASKWCLWRKRALISSYQPPRLLYESECNLWRIIYKTATVRMNLLVRHFFLVIFSNGFYLGIVSSQPSSSSTLQKTRNAITSTEVTPTRSGNECPCGITGGNGRIVGGDDADVEEYPWQVRKNLACRESSSV